MTLAKRHMTFVMFLILTIGLSALTRQTLAQTTAGGRLRFVHAVPGAPAVDITIDKVVAARSLEYAQATRFLSVPAGDHNVVISASGDTKPLFQGKVSVGGGQAETVIAQGAAAAVDVGIYEDDLGPVALGNTRFTASHALKDAPAIDVIKADGSPLIQGLKYGTVYGAFDIPAASMNLVVVPAGADAKSVVVKADNVPVIAGPHNRLVVLGNIDGSVTPPYLLLTAATDPENPAQSM